MTFRLQITGDGVLEIVNGRCTPQMDEMRKRTARAVGVDDDGNECVVSRELREIAYWHWVRAGSDIDEFLGECFLRIQENWKIIQAACTVSQAVKLLIAIDGWEDSRAFVHLNPWQVNICAQMGASFDYVVSSDEE